MDGQVHSNPQQQQPSSIIGSNEELLGIVLSGLCRQPKSLPSKLLYDQQGSMLFEQICATPEYYLTRAELALMEAHSAEIAEVLGTDVMLVEYGSGSGLKTRLLLSQMRDVAAYMPVDISSHALLESVEQLRRIMPQLTILPQCADFTQSFGALPPFTHAQRTIIYFPGSTIGNLDDSEVVGLLRRMRTQMGAAGGALIGFDLRKDPAVIEAAYNDAAGLTAQFTLNLLQRINRELYADIDPTFFAHRAVYHHLRGRIETLLISLREQTIQVAGEIIHFAQDESMLVEISCKYTPEEFTALAARAGLRAECNWFDADRHFCLQYLTPEAGVRPKTLDHRLKTYGLGLRGKI